MTLASYSNGYSPVDAFYESFHAMHTYKSSIENLRSLDMPIIEAYLDRTSYSMRSISYAEYRALYKLFEACMRCYPLYLMQKVCDLKRIDYQISKVDKREVTIEPSKISEILEEFLGNRDIFDESAEKNLIVSEPVKFCCTYLEELRECYSFAETYEENLSCYGLAHRILSTRRQSLNVDITNLDLYFEVHRCIRKPSQGLQIEADFIDQICDVQILENEAEQIRKLRQSMLTLSDTQLLYSIDEACVRLMADTSKREWLFLLVLRLFSTVWNLSEYSLSHASQNEFYAYCEQRVKIFIKLKLEQLSVCEQKSANVTVNQSDHTRAIKHALEAVSILLSNPSKTFQLFV